MDKRQIGDLGESFAASYYEKTGYKVVCRNFTCRGGEIDVIAENDDTLIFVEVKTRKADSLTEPKQAVDKRKIHRLTVAANCFLAEKESEKQIQFDVFEVWQNNGKVFKFNRIENAFEGEDFSGRYDVF